jgi:3-oxoacyl-[acyl-carrier-protein] synthase-3
VNQPGRSRASTSLRIAGWGTATPARVVTNAELQSRFGLPDTWIEDRTGITERRYAEPHDSTATLAISAGRRSLAHARVDPDKVDLLVVATTTPEQPIPSTAAFVAGALGLGCGSFDVNAACTGFITAFLTATAVLTTTNGHHALIIGAETFSRIVDPNDRSTAVVFGDAAAAVLLARTPNNESGLLAWDLGCDPSQRSLVELVAGGSRQPTTLESLEARTNYLRMSGRAVAEFAVPALLGSTRRTLRRAGLTISDIAALIPHQANARILERVAAELGLDPARMIVNIGQHGNTSAASIPLALADAADQDRIAAGDLILMTAVGAGMTWGSLLIRW